MPHFERESGHSVSIIYDLADLTLRRILDGETGDFVIVNTKAIDELVRKGKVVAGGYANLAQSGVGVSVLAGAPRPDISSVEAFRRALLDAKSIAYTSAGVSGLYFARLIERLGITAQVQAKSQHTPERGYRETRRQRRSRNGHPARSPIAGGARYRFRRAAAAGAAGYQRDGGRHPRRSRAA